MINNLEQEIKNSNNNKIMLDILTTIKTLMVIIKNAISRITVIAIMATIATGVK